MFKKKYPIFLKWILIILALLAASKYLYFYKWIGYERIPNNKIFDEWNYAFAGYSFRKTGVTIGWSNLDTYKVLADKKSHQEIGFNGTNVTTRGNLPSISNNQNFNYPVYQITDIDIGKGKETVTLVQPFLDHPIFGSWLYSLGIKKDLTKFDDLNPADYRQIALYASVVSGILIFISCYLLYKNLLISSLAFVIYSTVPNFVLMSRFALLENILIPLALLNIILIQLSFKMKKNYLLYGLIGLVSGLGFITKEQGIFIFLSSLFIFIFNKIEFKKIISFIIPFVLVSAIYYGYIFYLAPDLVFQLLFNQANRGFYGPLSLVYSFVQPKFENFPLDGYWLWGLISIMILFFNDFKKNIVILSFFISYLLVFLFFGGLSYPWYLLPFLPFLVIASSLFLYNLISKPNFMSLLLLFILPFSSSFFWGYSMFRNNNANLITIYRIFIIIFIVLFLIKKFGLKKVAFKNYIWAVIILVVFVQMYKWNLQGILYITSNWNTLPEIYTVR